ncbi:MAG TPA: cell division ATPase MinD [Candidatus Norongarragalinales archaeon]|nr:cell division ATPase MinD [Candidatus Norongarragalinales archaeon]
MTSLVFASGKGGVGKSTITLNLGLLLAQTGKKVVIVDADVQMANVGLMIGVDKTPISLNNVLREENVITEAVYEGPAGLKYVPSSISAESENLNYAILKKAVKRLEEIYDYVLIDCPPGLGEDALAAITSAKEMILVITPEPISLADALKVQILAEKNNVKINGFVLNMVLGDKNEIKPRELETILKLKNLGVLPEDVEVRRASAIQKPVALNAPSSKFTRSLRSLATQITGEQMQAPEEKRGFLAGIVGFFKNLFGKK